MPLAREDPAILHGPKSRGLLAQSLVPVLRLRYKVPNAVASVPWPHAEQRLIFKIQSNCQTDGRFHRLLR